MTNLYLDTEFNGHIYADWPDDFVHLMRCMSGPSYGESWMVPCTMVLLAESDPKPEIPHNALSDAIALMEWHRGLNEVTMLAYRGSHLLAREKGEDE